MENNYAEMNQSTYVYYAEIMKCHIISLQLFTVNLWLWMSNIQITNRTSDFQLAYSVNWCFSRRKTVYFTRHKPMMIKTLH